MELRSKGTALGIPSPAGCSEYSGLCSEVGPGFCPEYVRKAGSGIAADQTNAMLAVVRSSYSHRTRCRWASAGALFGEVVFSGAVGGVTTPPRCESRTQRLLWPQTAEFCTAPGICFTSVFSDAEGGKAVDSRLSTLLFQIQSRRKSDAEQRQKYRRSPSSADTCKPVFSMSLDICAIRNALRFSPFATPATHNFYKAPS